MSTRTSRAPVLTCAQPLGLADSFDRAGEEGQMALVQCEDCGGQVSEAASACPKCGAPPPRPPLGEWEYLCPECGKGTSAKVPRCLNCGASDKVHKDQFSFWERHVPPRTPAQIRASVRNAAISLAIFASLLIVSFSVINASDDLSDAVITFLGIAGFVGVVGVIYSFNSLWENHTDPNR